MAEADSYRRRTAFHKSINVLLASINENHASKAKLCRPVYFQKRRSGIWIYMVCGSAAMISGSQTSDSRNFMPLRHVSLIDRLQQEWIKWRDAVE
jgi:hypothetical protein